MRSYPLLANKNLGNYTILQEYIKCVLPTLTEVMSSAN
jgi:hypothetical protein